MNRQNKSLRRRDFLKSMMGASALLGTASLPAHAFSTLSSLSDISRKANAPSLLLHFNENSLGMSPKAIIAAQEAVALYGNRYPDDSVDQFKQQLAKHIGLKEQQLIMGNGSTEVIGAVVAYAAQQNATVIEPSPTFGDLRGRAKNYGMNVKQVDISGNFITDITALKKAANQTSGNLLINICNPNNPTGSIVDQKALESWINEAPDNHLFLIDEAYYEYAAPNPAYSSIKPLIQSGKENVIATRTFSKIYGMAGMRVGYGFAATETAKKIGAFARSFNLSAAGVAAAVESLKDQDFYEQSLKSNQDAKKILTNTLDSLNLPYIKSDTNFVLHRINSDLESYAKRMLQNNIKVGRRMTNEDGWNRVSVGRPDEMKVFAQTLQHFREMSWV